VNGKFLDWYPVLSGIQLNNVPVEMQRDDHVKDLGVMYNEHLSFSHRISDRISKAYSMLWLIKRKKLL